jgi:hypothetical protein
MSRDIKYLTGQEDFDWFINNGILVALNTLILHPLGLAAEINTLPDNKIYLTLWDDREDPEGVMYADDLASENEAAKRRREKFDTFIKLWQEKMPARLKQLGFHIQYGGLPSITPNNID